MLTCQYICFVDICLFGMSVLFLSGMLLEFVRSLNLTHFLFREKDRLFNCFNFVYFYPRPFQYSCAKRSRAVVWCCFSNERENVSYSRYFLIADVSYVLGKEILFLISEVFLQPILFFLMCFSDVKRTSGSFFFFFSLFFSSLFLSFFLATFLISEFLMCGIYS